jgi:hypothetical protein
MQSKSSLEIQTNDVLKDTVLIDKLVISNYLGPKPYKYNYYICHLQQNYLRFMDFQPHQNVTEWLLINDVLLKDGAPDADNQSQILQEKLKYLLVDLKEKHSLVLCESTQTLEKIEGEEIVKNICQTLNTSHYFLAEIKTVLNLTKITQDIDEAQLQAKITQIIVELKNRQHPGAAPEQMTNELKLKTDDIQIKPANAESHLLNREFIFEDTSFTFKGWGSLWKKVKERTSFPWEHIYKKKRDYGAHQEMRAEIFTQLKALLVNKFLELEPLLANLPASLEKYSHTLKKALTKAVYQIEKINLAKANSMVFMSIAQIH